MMKFIIFGAKGLVGSVIAHRLQKLGYQVYPLDKNEADIRKYDMVLEVIKNIKPDFVINAAAYLNADKCEENVQESYLTNVMGVSNIVKAIRNIKSTITLIHFSTDFVFDGKKGNYTEEDIPNPINIYGIHKWISDEIISNSDIPYYIFRIAAVIGWHPYKTTFQKAILRKAVETLEVEVVEDIYTSCSTPEFIAEVIIKFLETNPPYGLYNVVATGGTSWFNIAKVLFEYLALPFNVIPIKRTHYNFKALRPINSTLNVSKLASYTGIEKHWQDIIIEHLEIHKDKYLKFIKELKEKKL